METQLESIITKAVNHRDHHLHFVQVSLSAHDGVATALLCSSLLYGLENCNRPFLYPDDFFEQKIFHNSSSKISTSFEIVFVT